MGQARTYKCTKCGNEIELYEGIGMMWHSFDKSMFYPPTKDSCSLNFYDEFDKNMLNKIHKFIEESEDVFVLDAYYQPYICNKCGKIESKICFKMYDLKTDKMYRLRYTCKCGGQYRKLRNKDIENLCCNKCGNEMIEVFEKLLFWD